jgi:hypothetical protein
MSPRGCSFGHGDIILPAESSRHRRDHFLATDCSGLHTWTAGDDCNRLLAIEAATIFAARSDLRQLFCPLSTGKRRLCGGRWRKRALLAGVGGLALAIVLEEALSPTLDPVGLHLSAAFSESVVRKECVTRFGLISCEFQQCIQKSTLASGSGAASTQSVLER